MATAAGTERDKHTAAEWIADCVWPAKGTLGSVERASGFYDPDSAEYGAYMFRPNDETDVTYCSEDDFQYVDPAA